MTLKELCQREIEDNYRITESLINLVEAEELDWEPGTGKNWLNMGQLLYHLTESCGKNFEGFITGKWDIPGLGDNDDESIEELLTGAAQHPHVTSIEEAKKLLEEDKQTALDNLAKVSEEELSSKMVQAPWESVKKPLGHQLLYMIDHLKQHKGQLYYYLKLQGKEVNSTHLWG